MYTYIYNMKPYSNQSKIGVLILMDAVFLSSRRIHDLGTVHDLLCNSLRSRKRPLQLIGTWDCWHFPIEGYCIICVYILCIYICMCIYIYCVYIYILYIYILCYTYIYIVYIYIYVIYNGNFINMMGTDGIDHQLWFLGVSDDGGFCP
jgi:hypothetical protein